MTELARLRAVWEAERAELERRQLALAAVGVSIAAGRYEEAQKLLDSDTQQQHTMHLTISTEPAMVPIVEAAQQEERRGEVTKKKKAQRVDKPAAPQPKKISATKAAGGGRPRSEKEGFEWHSSINKHTKYRCLQCDEIVGVRLIGKHECGD